jgi:diphthamide synthase (EF-2-diphthine--ammonia ligase)
MYHVFISWSGGKDSCLACYQAMVSGLEVRYLLNMITEDGRRSWTHRQSVELLQAQSQAKRRIPVFRDFKTFLKNQVRGR